ncbi:CDP-glycerol glycerophosphotransferase [Fictibacillus solisalsi]|uniref:CDP-glycerol glycerophosphotransferase n=1 Tax=Fictibacillus solisalsi TaxID=459525 RepID=A0A1G9YJD2_9BACL|nr:CDP-glycerol glycerophosphotransferase family protein [Fictibacillus solisalsi]SDN09052.1 CDP-glycerol glycerophosphotransferase [Fictibacillus solisalsi]
MKRVKNTILIAISVIFFSWRKKDHNLFIFNSFKNERYDFNSKYFFEYLICNSSYSCKFIINNEFLRNYLNKEVGEFFISTSSLKHLKEIWRAGVWITSTGMPIRLNFFHKDRVIVNLWHGVPLKKIGLLDHNISIIRKLIIKRVYSKCYSFISTSSKNLITVMADSFLVSKDKIRVLGQPRNDKLLCKSPSKIEDYFENIPLYKKIILYAPTFRENTCTNFFPFNDRNLSEVDRFLEENQLIIFIRNHPLEKGLDELSSLKRIFFINSDKVDDIMEALKLFDLLITDYSSIFIDYLILERPIVFLDYDREDYLSSRGLNFDYDEVTPGPKPKSQKQFLLEIKHLLSDKTYFYEERKKVNEFFNAINEGSCKRTLIEIEKELCEINKS